MVHSEHRFGLSHYLVTAITPLRPGGEVHARSINQTLDQVDIFTSVVCFRSASMVDPPPTFTTLQRFRISGTQRSAENRRHPITHGCAVCMRNHGATTHKARPASAGDVLQRLELWLPSRAARTGRRTAPDEQHDVSTRSHNVAQSESSGALQALRRQTCALQSAEVSFIQAAC